MPERARTRGYQMTEQYARLACEVVLSAEFAVLYRREQWLEDNPGHKIFFRSAGEIMTGPRLIVR